METSTSSFLRRPQALLCILLGICFLVLRLWQLDLRPMHNDEGVNYHFLMEMTRRGYYPYSHKNYHGPSYFYLTRLCTLLFGYSEYGIRSSAVFIGSLGPLLILWFATGIPFAARISMSIFSGFCASTVFINRYAIHESLFVFGTTLLALAVWRWHRTRNPLLHLWSGIGLGIVITTKETFIISLFCVFFAFCSLGDYRSVLRDLWEQRQDIAKGCALTALITILLFSGGGIWAGGLREMLLAVPQWIGRNESDTGHFKPFLTYLWMILGENGGGAFVFAEVLQSLRSGIPLATKGVRYGAEWHLLLLGFLPVPFLYSVRAHKTSQPWWEGTEGRESLSLLRYLSIWGGLSFLVYSCVNYKTPWLVHNISFPLSLSLGLLLYLLWKLHRGIGGGLTLAAGLTMIVLTIVFNFSIPYGNANPYSYVHTRQGMLDFIDAVKNFEKKAGRPARVLVHVGQYWPLPYYFRNTDSQVSYLKPTKGKSSKLVEKYDIALMPRAYTHTSPNYIARYYRLSDVQETTVLFRLPEVKEP